MLTDTAIRQAKPKSKSYSLNDFDGLSLFVAINGSKSWHFRFQFKGKAARISFGTYPELSLKDARQLRDENRSLIAKGIDPRIAKQEEQRARNVLTFAKYAEQWKTLRIRKKGIPNPERRQSTMAQIDRYLHKDLFPILGHIPLAEVTRANVLTVLRNIEDRGSLCIAGKCRRWLNEIFRYALAEGLVSFNPASDLDILALPQRPVKHNPFLSMPELPEFLAQLDNYQGNRIVMLGVKLLFLTGVRTGELRYSKAEYFDLKNQVWNIPANLVKQLQAQVRTNDNSIPPYVVPLPRQAIEIVQELMRYHYDEQKYFIAHRFNLTLPASENTFNQAIKRIGYQGRLTGHGIRATLSTALNGLAYPREWIEAQLSHSDKDQIRAAYNHAQYVEQRRNMMQEWADKIDEWREAGQTL